MEDLMKLRESIDEIDSEIVRLYKERMDISKHVAEYKITTGKKVFDKTREDEKLEKLSSLADDEFLKHGIVELFEQIMSTSRKKQYQLMTEHGIVEKENFTEVDSLDFSNARIVFQGVEGAYSQLAMKTYFGENCNGYNVDSWKDAMEDIKCGKADYAVLPIENSSAGIVSENYDLLVEYDNYIVGEQIIRIDHSLMGLPGAVYAFGTGQAWIAIGLFIGTVCNWIFISGRLRRYTIRANNSLTLPEYFQNRFHDKKNVLLCISSIVIVVFFLVYTASAFAAGGKLFHAVTGVDYTVALTIGAVVILLYTFMGGFMAVCVTDFIQGMLMLVALLAVPLMAYAVVSGNGGLRELLDASGVAGGSDSYMSLWQNGGEPYRAIDIISQLAWGLGYCGMPHILTRFMAVKSQKELNKSKGIAIVWVALSLTFACIIGVVGRAYLYPEVLGSAGADSAENVFINMITHLFTKQYALPFVAGIFLCGILAAIMSTADSQLLVTASSVSEDIYKGVVNKEASDKKVLMVSRITVVVVAIIAYIIALNPNNSIMGLVSNAWAGFGAAFGPLVVLSLFWKRTNKPGAIAGIVSGGVAVIIWDYIPLMKNADGAMVTLGTGTGIYSLLVGFFLSLICIVIVSLCTKAPNEEMQKEFADVADKNIEL